MKVIFMGTPVFATVCLKALYESKHHVSAVVTQPDRPAGRGKRLVFSPVKEFALSHNLPCLQPQTARCPDLRSHLTSLVSEIYVVAAYGLLLPNALLDLPKFGAINVHASLLPKFRGASPIQQAIVCGETLTGITIIQMAKGMDTGDMLLKREVPISPEDTGGTLHDKLCGPAAEAMLAALDQIEAGRAAPVRQNHGEATYAPLITKHAAQIDFSKSPREIVNFVRAYNPVPGASTQLFGQFVKIWQVKDTGQASAAEPGSIVKACPKTGVFVAAGGGVLEIAELTPQGKKRMTAADFVKGAQK